MQSRGREDQGVRSNYSFNLECNGNFLSLGEYQTAGINIPAPQPLQRRKRMEMYLNIYILYFLPAIK